MISLNSDFAHDHLYYDLTNSNDVAVAYTAVIKENTTTGTIPASTTITVKDSFPASMPCSSPYVSSEESTAVLTVTISADGYIDNSSSLSITRPPSCLTGDTLITLSNGTQKRIDELTLTDKVLSINPATLELVEDEIVYCDSACNKTHDEYDIWKFEDGYEIKTVHRHRLYNCESESFVNMDEWAIGDHTRTINGKEIALLEHQHINELVKHYTIFTKTYNNYFANGLLTGNKYSKEITFIDENKNRNK